MPYSPEVEARLDEGSALAVMLRRRLGDNYIKNPRYESTRRNLGRIQSALRKDFELLEDMRGELQARAGNNNASPIELEIFSESRHIRVRREVAANRRSTVAILEKLVADKEKGVRKIAQRGLRRIEIARRRNWR